MPRKFAVITALALSTVVGSAAIAPNSKYVGCNTGKVEQGRGSFHKGGLLF